jgi:hypothetical protein
MKYTIKKIFSYLVSLTFLVIAVASFSASVFAIFIRPNIEIAFSFIIITLISTNVTIVAIKSYRKNSKFQKNTYQYYCTAYPNNVKNNSISCHSCGCSKVHVKALMNRTFHREHFCTQCGTVLYYSREGG